MWCGSEHFWLKLGRPATAFVHQRGHAVTIVSRRPLLEMHPSRLLPTAAVDKYIVLGKSLSQIGNRVCICFLEFAVL